jgi:hypothetical protein
MKVEGYVNIGSKIEFDDVEFIQRKKWIEAVARVSEVNREAAENVAVRKVSDILNVLSFVSDCSIKLVGVEPAERSGSLFPVTIRILNADEIQRWKTIDGLREPQLFRGLGYYRKGLNELDPFDAFLAFWSAVEIVCSHSRGRCIANKILSFARTHSIEIDESEVHDLKGTRNRIVHGVKRYDIDQIKRVAEKIPRIRELAKRFLEAKIPQANVGLFSRAST